MRKGQLFGKTVVLLILVSSIVLLMGIAGILSSNTNNKIRLKSKALKGLSTSMEKVMNAPCLTEGRGVIKSSALESGGGDLGCINIKKAMIGVNRGMEGNCFQDADSKGRCYYFKVYEEDGDVKVEKADADSFISITKGEDAKPNIQYPVSIVDREKNTREPGVVRVVFG